MKEMEYLEELTSRYPVLEAVKGDVLAAYESCGIVTQAAAS